MESARWVWHGGGKPAALKPHGCCQRTYQEPENQARQKILLQPPRALAPHRLTTAIHDPVELQKISIRRPGCLKPGFSLVKCTSPLLILTGMFKACFHASVESVPPLPSFQLFLFLCVVQAESFILHLSRQFTHPLLGFLHQCVEVRCSAFQADNWREKSGVTPFSFWGNATSLAGYLRVYYGFLKMPGESGIYVHY